MNRYDSEWFSPAFLQRVTEGALFVFVLSVLVSISAMQAAYIVAIATWLLRLYREGADREVRLPLLVPVCGFVLASLVSTILALHPFQSFVELRNIFEVVVFYMAVNTIRSEEHATKLIYTLMIVGFLMAVYGFLETLASGTALRISGTSTYMTFGGQLMLVTTLILAQLLFTGRTRHTIWLLPALLVVSAALLLTQTRNAWLGVAAAALFLLGLRHKLLLFTLPLLVLGLFLVAPPAVKSRIQSMGDLQDITVQQRFSMWRSGWRIALDYPWVGTGMGAMRETYHRYQEPQAPFRPSRRLSHLHNSFVQILAERGFIGLAWWLAIWGAFLYQTWRVFRGLGPQPGQAKALVVGSLAGVVGFLVAGTFEYNFGDSEVLTLVYFLMAIPFVVQLSESQLSSVDEV